MLAVTLVLATFLLLLLFIVRRRPKSYPPGPRGCWVLGYLPFITEHDPKYPFMAMRKLAEIYGPVVGFYLGPQFYVSVCGYDAVREALQNDDLNGRPRNATILSRTFYKRLGVMFTDGDVWQEQRRFTLRHLRDLGFGKTSIENQMMDEIHELLNDIRAKAQDSPDRVVDFTNIFKISMINILWAIVGGERFRRNDCRFIELLSAVEKFFRSGNVLRATVPIPLFLLRLLPFLSRYVSVKQDLIQPLQQFIAHSIEDHEMTRNEVDAPRDFIDVYLDEMNKTSTARRYFNKEQLAAIVLDLFGAGAESSSNSIGFATLHLLHDLEAQRRMQDEMDEVCGRSLPSLKHRASLPYTEAVLREAQRISSIAPFTVPHYSLRETKLKGYTIPKGSITLVNLNSVLHEESYWSDPEVFRPERHLNREGQLVKSDHLFPFGSGKRMCLGESLAKNTYFLFTTSLFKTFRFLPLAGETLPSLDPINGFTLGYHGFKAVVIPRT